MKVLRKKEQAPADRKITSTRQKEQAPADRKMTVECIHCNEVHSLAEVVKIRKWIDETPNDTDEVGIECPRCGHWHTIYYETEAIRAARRAIEMAFTPKAKAAAQVQFKAIYAAEQERVKAEIGP